MVSALSQAVIISSFIFNYKFGEFKEQWKVCKKEIQPRIRWRILSMKWLREKWLELNLKNQQKGINCFCNINCLCHISVLVIETIMSVFPLIFKVIFALQKYIWFTCRLEGNYNNLYTILHFLLLFLLLFVC